MGQASVLRVTEVAGGEREAGKAKDGGCEREQVSFQSKIDLMIELVQQCEPVAGTLTHVLLDSWYSAKAIWKAARERGFLITTGLTCNRSLRIEDASQPAGWQWQRLDAYATSLSAEEYTQRCWPRDEEAEPIFVHVVSTRIRKRSVCQVIIVHRSLSDPISQTRYWASSDRCASVQEMVEQISARWDIDVLFADIWVSEACRSDRQRRSHHH